MKSIPRKQILAPGRHSQGVKRVNKQKSNILKDIYKYQMTNDYLFRRLPFARVVKEIMCENQQYHGEFVTETQYRIQKEALNALQFAAEAFIVELFAMAQLCAEHAGRVTIFNRDVLLTLRIRKQFV